MNYFQNGVFLSLSMVITTQAVPDLALIKLERGLVLVLITNTKEDCVNLFRDTQR